MYLITPRRGGDMYTRSVSSGEWGGLYRLRLATLALVWYTYVFRAVSVSLNTGLLVNCGDGGLLVGYIMYCMDWAHGSPVGGGAVGWAVCGLGYRLYN